MSTNPISPNFAAPAVVPSNAPAALASAAPVVPIPGAPKPIVTFEDFAKLDLRIARVVHAENHPKADRLFKLQLDDGSGTPRQICAGIRDFYKAEDLIGRLIVVVANLAPRVIRGEESRGMLLAASDVPKDAAASDPNVVRRVIVLKPDGDIQPGAIVS
ncbi:hypothetical protein BH11PLA1_BH11PLA1_03850 [soil metagenome]